MRYALTLIAVQLALTPCSGIEVYPENPFYWAHDGKPILLLGASGDDNLFQWAGAGYGDRLTEHLDALVAVGGNYVRNTMNSRNHACDGYNDDQMAYPFRKLPSGKYDLDAWNPDYWNRLARFLAETRKRGIFVQLELIARGLQELEDAGVVVLFHPFHEMNGKWFWWGATNAPQEFIKLWRFTFDYLTHQKGLDNLLWVYSPGATSGRHLEFYPGDAYVDMVGLDTYSKTPAQIRTHGYNTLTALGKPFGLTEFGPSNLSNWDADPRRDYDYEALIRDVEEDLPLCTFFTIWHQYYGLHFQRNAKQCLDHPWVANRADVPPFGR